MNDTDFADFDTPETAASWAAMAPADTSTAPGEHRAKVAIIRTSGRADTLWLEVVFQLESGDRCDPIIAPIAAHKDSQHPHRLCEGWRLIRALYAAEGRLPPDNLKSRHLTHFVNLPVIATIAVCQIDGAAKPVVRSFASAQQKG